MLGPLTPELALGSLTAHWGRLVVGGARGEGEEGTTPAAACSAHSVECGSGSHPGLLSQGSRTPGGWSPQPEEMTDATSHGLQSLEAGPAANVEAAHLYTR